jgi:hypothetical protein
VVERAEGDDVLLVIVSPAPDCFHVVWVDNSMDAVSMFAWMLPAVQTNAAVSSQRPADGVPVDYSFSLGRTVYISQAGCSSEKGIS